MSQKSSVLQVMHSVQLALNPDWHGTWRFFKNLGDNTSLHSMNKIAQRSFGANTALDKLKKADLVQKSAIFDNMPTPV
jgi:hypothetical protein